MESSGVLGESSAKASDVTPAANDADDALLEICKEMSASLQRLELYLTSRAKAVGMSANPNAKAVRETAREEQNPTPELVIENIEENPLPEMENLDTISNVSGDSQDDAGIPLPPTVYYKGASLGNLQRVARAYELPATSITGHFDRKGDIHREIVDNLPQSNTSVDWKYYVPLFDKSHFVGERVGLGGGRTDFGWKWTQMREGDFSFWKSSLAHFVPYSHVLPRRRRLATLFTEEQHAVFRDLLGGLYTIPSDQRLDLSFQAFELQQQNWDSAMKTVTKFLSLMKLLRDFGGSFTIRDFSNSPAEHKVSDIFPGVALYGYKRRVLKATAQDAEEYVINIPPIGLHESTGTSPWRRLIICEGFARLEDRRSVQGIASSSRSFESLDSIHLHLSNGRRTPADLDHTSSRNIFHINWFVLEYAWIGDENLDQLYTAMKQKPRWRHGTLYGSEDKKLGITSFTIQAIEANPFNVLLDKSYTSLPSQDDFGIISSRDSMYWTILVFTPIWYSRARPEWMPMVDTGHMKIGTIHVTMLSGIKAGLDSAVDSWREIGDYLEELLGAEDIFLDPEAHDKFCFYDHNDLSQSKKCFWIINSVDKFDKSIQDTLYQWEWFYQTHIKYLLSGKFNDKVPQHELLNELRNDIDLLYQKLKAQSERFLSIQKEARELRDGLFGASNLINAKESVQEAKNSARLGETVKLLTLVTIFFLPLGYITSLWAIIAAPDLKKFASVSVGTALATYLVVLAVVKWENISTAWVTSQNRITSSWSHVAKGSKSKSEKNKNRARDDGEERPKSRFANLRSRLHYRRGNNHGGANDAHQLDEISLA